MWITTFQKQGCFSLIRMRYPTVQSYFSPMTITGKCSYLLSIITVHEAQSYMNCNGKQPSDPLTPRETRL